MQYNYFYGNTETEESKVFIASGGFEEISSDKCEFHTFLRTLWIILPIQDRDALQGNDPVWL
jgi:hypothetical protein